MKSPHSIAGGLVLLSLGTACHRTAGPPQPEGWVRAVDFETGAVQGTVRWNGMPVPSVAVGGSSASHVWSAGTDGAGHYAVSTVAVDDYSVTVRLAGMCSVILGQRSVSVVAATTTVADFDVTATLGRVSGAVTVNGAPFVGGISIRLTENDGGAGAGGSDAGQDAAVVPDAFCLTSLATGADGHFSGFLPQGTYAATFGNVGAFTFTVAAGQPIELPPFDVSAPILPTGTVEGTVSWNGAPAAGPGFSVTGITPALPIWSATTDALGRFVAVVPAGDYSTTLRVGGMCTPLLDARAVSVTSASTTTVDFDVTATMGRVSGNVTINGAPLAAASIAATLHPAAGAADAGETPFCQGFAQTSGDGRFEVLLPAGAYTATVFTGSQFGSFSFTVVAGAQIQVPTIELAGGTVAGTIFWNGAPAAGLSLAASSGTATWGATTDGAGHYQAVNVPPGSYDLLVRLGGMCPPTVAERTVLVAAGATTTTDVDITSGAGRVTGSLTANGLPLSNAGVSYRLRPSGGGGSGGSGGSPPSCMAGDRTANGLFSSLLPVGTYDATVFAGTVLGGFSFTVLAGQTTDVDSVNTPAQANLQLDLRGGTAAVNGMSLLFSNVMAPGNTIVVQSGTCIPSCSPPPTGYQIAGSHYWDISTTATYTGPIVVCLHYDPTEICGGLASCPKESSIVLLHDAGAGFVNITRPGSLNTQTKQICGTTMSLSPFAIAVPLAQPNTSPTVAVPADKAVEATGPSGATVTFAATAADAEDGALAPTCVPASEATFPIGSTTVTCTATDSAGATGSASFIVTVSDTAPPIPAAPPATVIAYATSTAGATVAYTAPAFTDAVDGAIAAHCTPASGSKFAPGKTTVTCTASDAHGNAGAASLTIWVQYQAPTDGTFFLKPIRSDGSSVFRVGRAVPVKFQLTGASAGITNLVAKLVVTKISDQVRGSADDQSDEDGDDTDFLFKYRKLTKIYGYRWKTLGQSQGTYRLTADLGDRVVHEVNVSLKVKP
jgi:hypothetical protein